MTNSSSKHRHRGRHEDRHDRSGGDHSPAGARPSDAASRPAQSTPEATAPAAGQGPAAPGAAASFDYGKLAFASPLAEFEDHVRLRVRNAERLGRREDAELVLEAFELGKKLLAPEDEA